MFLCLFKHGPQVSQLWHATLNITMEGKHEPKAADIVIQFVLLLRNSPTLYQKAHHITTEDGYVIKRSTLSWKEEGPPLGPLTFAHGGTHIAA